MWKTGNTRQTATGMRRYNLEVLGISETHETQAGQKSQDTGEMLLYSGHKEENAPQTQGVALMLSKVARNALRSTQERNWKSIKEALTSTCQEVLGLKKHHHKESISIETLDKIKERRNKKTAINNSRTRTEKVQAQAEYIEANKQVKKSIRANKYKYVEELATTMEKAAREGNMKQLSDTTKKLSGKYSKPERPVKDKEGRPITEIQQQRNIWVECFEELLNRPAPINPPDIEAAHTDFPIDVNSPTTEEIRMAIRQIKNGKAARPDNIPVEALKSDIEVTTNMLHSSQKDLGGVTSADGLERRTPRQDSKERRYEQM
ncbi:unnamed protein product [Schistosoma margrebowiei]|uniref:Uncharacterized protein n=1 Tax=Schistosoma margrebowiei TaxID=48269 RepID=A0A183LY93_9TREM|nr:unnamed protein product [Schistosoma margrebowiei]